MEQQVGMIQLLDEMEIVQAAARDNMLALRRAARIDRAPIAVFEQDFGEVGRHLKMSLIGAEERCLGVSARVCRV